MPRDVEVPLTGGNVSVGVVRVGGTVRKPATAATPAVEAFLGHLAAAGFTGAPRTLGRDERGRHVLEYVPGVMADTLPPMTPAELRRLGAMIRGLHDAAAGFTPPPGARWEVVIPPDREELVCHHDLAPWNLVRDGERWVFIDFDGAGPGSRLWDLGYAAHGFVPLRPGGDPAHDAARLRALADGYRLDAHQRAALPELTAEHVRGMHRLLVDGARRGRRPWARLHAQGHAAYWAAAADYAAAHRGRFTAALLA
ncbi:phosphotransferase enzyme family protein [Marinactinospora rubrisoli]|uniref:Phosphotransferase enzyme family protein n=1 Tax=Marinactinospora rubrisoli TaxID=2715399 RepID=A0ABW2KPG0_9ACTN